MAVARVSLFVHARNNIAQTGGAAARRADDTLRSGENLLTYRRSDRARSRRNPRPAGRGALAAGPGGARGVIAYRGRRPIHHVGVVHRDFKAANVLLGPDGPVVIDFGVAKALGTAERQLTVTGQQVGTPAYMAPEQFKDDPVGPEADIFAWGVTMVFAATGALPFGDGSIASVMYRILSEAPDLGGLHGPMRDLVAACLAKDPATRPTARQIVDRLMSVGNVPEPTAAEAAAAHQPGDSMPGSGAALYTIDPLHNVPMRQDSVSAGSGVLPLMSAGGPTVRRGLRGRPRIPRAALIAVAVVIVLAAGTVVGLKAFTSPGPHDTAAAAVAGGTSTVSTVSGANGSTSTTRYDSLDALGSGTLAPSGKTAGIPYFEPAKGDWDSLDGVQRCEIIGSNGTTEGIICLGLLEGNSGGGTTWYTPALTAYCETISTRDDVACVKIAGDFGMYSATGVQEAPKEHGWCDQSHGNLCSSGKNVFVDTDGYSWMTVNTAAADSCQRKGGEGTDCEIHPYAYAGVDIELPGGNKNATLGASYTGPDAIGY